MPWQGVAPSIDRENRQQNNRLTIQGAYHTPLCLAILNEEYIFEVRLLMNGFCPKLTSDKFFVRTYWVLHISAWLLKRVSWPLFNGNRTVLLNFQYTSLCSLLQIPLL